MGICNRDLCMPHEYNDAEDHQKLGEDLDFITVREGFFTVFFPHDCHIYCASPQIEVFKITPSPTASGGEGWDERAKNQSI